MKGIVFLTKRTALFILVAVPALCISCSNIYDNIKDFSVEEIVYPARYDTIVARPGYERIELDLLKEGRLPSSMVKLGKATKTIIEYDTVVLKYDSIFSWISIGNLKLPKLYRFRVYTSNDDGDLSIPQEIALAPYTSVDREALAVPSPTLTTIGSFVMVQWSEGLTSNLMYYLGLSYSYTDKNGETRSGTSRDTQFFVTNIEENREVEVSVRYWVIPRIEGENILDSVSFDQSLHVTMAEGSTPIEFTVSPTQIALLPGRQQVASASVRFGLLWTSSNPAVATVNANGVILARAPGTAVITVKSPVFDEPATITVNVSDLPSTFPQKERLAGMWTFEDVTSLEKATVGLNLERSGYSNLSSIEGPNNTKAVKFGTATYYTIRHNMSANGGGSRVNEYTLMMDIRTSADLKGWISVFNTRSTNIENGVLLIDSEEHIGNSSFGGFSDVEVTPEVWHRLVITAKFGSSPFRVYLDGSLVWQTNSNLEIDGILSLLTDAMYVGFGNRGNGYPTPDFAEIRIWNTVLTEAQIIALGKP